jgi:hypothetical protein
MARENIDVVPVISNHNNKIISALSYQDIIGVYKVGIEDHEKKIPDLSLKKYGLKMLVRGKKIVSVITQKNI